MEIEYIKLRSIEGRLRELEQENNELRRALEFKDCLLYTSPSPRDS